MPSPDSERCRETYNSPTIKHETVSEAIARYRRAKTEALTAAREETGSARVGMQKQAERAEAAEHKLAAAEARVRELEAKLHEWEQRAWSTGNELDRAQRRIGDLEEELSCLKLRAQSAEAIAGIAECGCDLSTPAAQELGCAGHKAPLQVAFTNSIEEPADDWYAAEVARLGTPTA